MTTMQTLEARDLFDNLGKEEEQPSNRIIEVRAGSVLEQLVKQFEEYLAKGTLWDAQQNIIQIGRSQSGIRASDIEQLSIILNGYDDEIMFEFSTGWFLTKCFNVCKDRDITVYTRGWKSPPHHLSLQTDKRVTVYGNVGDCLGLCMTRGRITVNGNARRFVGQGMEGGTLSINGDYDGITEVINTKRNIYHKGKPIVLDGKVV